MRDWANLDDAATNTFAHRKDVGLLRELLRPAERLLAVAHAGDPRGRLGLGLLAVTDQRIVFVCERFLRRPSILPLPFENVRSVRLAEEPISGTLSIDTTDGSLKFRLIRPEERTWPLYWRISERIGQLPLGEHS